MKPVSEYKTYAELVNDARDEGLMKKGNEEWARLKMAYAEEELIRRTMRRITTYLAAKDDTRAPRLQVYNRLNLYRVGSQVVEEGLNRLYIDGTVYIERDNTEHRGPKSAILVYNPHGVPAVDISAEELAKLRQTSFDADIGLSDSPIEEVL